MPTTILLIRHAAHGHLGAVLSGRTPDLPLTACGEAQAYALARVLAHTRLDRVASSPALRARQTASVIAGATDETVEIVPALDEIDFGDWTGRDFAQLAADPLWHLWNNRRSEARAPRGESMIEAQARCVAYLRAIAVAYPGGTIAAVSHCDIIRAVVAHYLRLSLDDILRFEIDAASLSRLALDADQGRILSLNERAAR